MEPTQPSAAFLALQQQLEQSQALAANPQPLQSGTKPPKVKKPKGQGKQPRNPKRATNPNASGVAPASIPATGGSAAPAQKPKKKKATGKSSTSGDQLALAAAASQVAVPTNTRDLINLQQLRRYDTDVEAVLLNCTHTVLYELSSAGNQSLWQKKPFEGPMFLVRRSSAPYHRIVILNRVNPENFLFSLDENVQWEQKDCYIFFQDPAVDVVRGLWFSYESEAQRAAAALNQAVSDVAPPAPSATGAVTPNRHDSDRKHFFGLLSRAGIMPQPPPVASGALPPVVTRSVSGTGLPPSDSHGMALLQMLQGAQSPDVSESKVDLQSAMSLSDIERGLSRKKTSGIEDPSLQTTAKPPAPTGGAAALPSAVQRTSSLSSIPVGSPTGGPNSALLMPSALLLASEKPPGPLKPPAISTNIPGSSLSSANPSSPASVITSVSSTASVSSAIPSSAASASLLQLLKPTNITAAPPASTASQPVASASAGNASSSSANPLGSPVPRLTPGELLRGTSVPTNSTAPITTSSSAASGAPQVAGLLKPRLLLSASPPPSGPSSVGDSVTLTSIPSAELVTVHFTNKPPTDSSIMGAAAPAVLHARADSNGIAAPSVTTSGAGPALPDLRTESDKSPPLSKAGLKEVLEKITQDEALLDLVYQRYLKHDLSGSVFESL